MISAEGGIGLFGREGRDLVVVRVGSLIGGSGMGPSDSESLEISMTSIGIDF